MHPSILVKSGYCQQALSFFARAGAMSARDKTVYNQFIRGLISDGLWVKFDALYIFAASTSAIALLNLVSSSFNCTLHGSTFAAYQGFTGVDGSTTDYLDTGFNAATATSPKYTQNNAHISVWSNAHTTPAAGAITTGTNDGITTITGINCRYLDGSRYFRINDSLAGASGGVAAASSKGLHVATRISSTTGIGYFGTTDQGISASTSAAVSNLNYYVLLNNLGGNPAGGDTHPLSEASIGSNLTAADVAKFFNRLTTLRTAFGLAP